MATKLENIFSKKPVFIIHKVNFHKHLKTFGFTEEDIRNKISTNLSNEENCVVVYPPGCKTAVIITLQESEEQSLHQLHIKSNANVRGFLKLHQHFFDHGLHIIGIVGAVFFSKEKIGKNYCTECPDVTILSIDDIKSEVSFKKWWMEMKEKFKKAFRYFSFDTEDYSSESDLDEGYDTKTNPSKVDKSFAGLLVIANAVTNDKFSALASEDDDKGTNEDEIINKMILNESQRNVLRDQKKHKIIKGSFLLKSHI